MPPPKGYTLDAPKASGLPAGYTLDGPTPAAPDFTSNPKGEGLYRMSKSSPGVWGDAPEVQVPFGKVQDATNAGYRVHPDDAPRYQKDFTHQGQGPTLWDKTKSTFAAATEPMADTPLEWNTGQHTVGSLVRSAPAALSNVGKMPFNAVNRTVRGLVSIPGGTVGAVQNIAQGKPEGLESVNPIAMGEGEYKNLQNDTANLGPAAAWSNVGGDAATAYLMGRGTQAATGLASKALPPAADMVGRGVEAVGGKMQDAGANVINRTVGALKADFKHGGNPGQGYFQAGFGPSTSIGSIANKAGVAREATGATLGGLYDAATDSGYKIPVQDVADAIRTPVQKAMQVTTGPGGTGDVAPFEQFGASFRPPMQAAAENGGFTPSELFGVKRNVAANTVWNDPTQVNLNKVRQQTTGAIGGVLSDHLPETAPLNSQYQNLSSLENRATLRAQTGSSPLTHLVTKTALGGAAALAGRAVNPLASAAAGLGAMALDSVPVKTTVASGLYYGGKGVATIGKSLQSVFTPPETPTGAQFSFAARPPQLEANVPGNAGYGADYTAGSIPTRSPIAPPAPVQRMALPQSTTPGTPQPMVGVKANQYPPLATDYARTRVTPTVFRGPTDNPFALPKGLLKAPAPKVKGKG